MTTLNEAEKTGVWWTDPWWESAELLADTGLTLEKVRARIEALKRLFAPAWMRAAFQAGLPNVVIPVLCGGTGSWPFQNLMWLGRLAAALVDVPSIDRPLESIIGSKSRAALFEMEVAAWFAERKWEVEFLKEQNDASTPDIRISRASVRSAVECKTIEPEAWEEWVEQLSFHVLRRLDDPAINRSVSFDVILAPRLSELNTNDANWQRELTEGIAERIARELVQMRSIGAAGEVLHIPGIAEVRFFPDRPASQMGVGGVEISPHFKMRKILQNAVEKGGKQLCALGDPGVVIVRSDFVPLPDLVEVVLGAQTRADPQLLSSTTHVVIVGPIDRPVIWQNPMLTTNPVSNALAGELEAIFGDRSTSRLNSVDPPER